MKYIIDIPEDAKYGILTCKVDRGYYAKDIDLAETEQLTADYINEHFGDLQDTAYQKGINDGSLDVKQRVEGAYQKGFEKGKDVRIKGCEGCMYQDTTIEHNPCNLCCNAFLNRWTAKQTDDKIEVGDEVEWDNDFTGDRFIVTRIYQPYGKKEQCDGIDDDGDVYRAVLIESLVKTGRHFDIKSILEEMRYD